MKKVLKSICLSILLAVLCAPVLHGQEAKTVEGFRASVISIMQAEDELRFDETIENYLKGNDRSLKIRAVLAAGRIGDSRAVPLLAAFVLDKDAEIAQMAAFALGEIESDAATVALAALLEDTEQPDQVRARAVEAAGKIAGANAESESVDVLRDRILDNLQFEFGRGIKQSREVVLFGITAVIRSKPVGGDAAVSRFLTNLDARIRLDAANALARLGSTQFNQQLKIMLVSDTEPLARANAARALGAAKDESAVALIIKAAVEDKDQRVRVTSVGALGRMANKEIASQLITRAEKLFLEYKKSKYKRPSETNELMVLASAIGNILKDSNDKSALGFLNKLSDAENGSSSEVEVALIRVSPSGYAAKKLIPGSNGQRTSAVAQAFSTFADAPDSVENNKLKLDFQKTLADFLRLSLNGNSKSDKSAADVLSAYAAYNPQDLPEVSRTALKEDDVILRATAARVLGEEAVKENSSEVAVLLRAAYEKSKNDVLNDASLAVLGAIKKQILVLQETKKGNSELIDAVKDAANSPDYLVRRSAREIAKEVGLELEEKSERVLFDEKGVSRVKRADYRRAFQREKAKAVLTTAKGKFTIEFYPMESPLTVENFINLAKAGYFNGLSIHRVVPNFVMQDGDPRGDGNGGPGWSIRCEINQLTYERGSVGMALSGKDTGGSQWFVAHSPQPHLDGGYTVFGKVNEEGMNVVDMLVRRDVIERVEIVE